MSVYDKKQVGSKPSAGGGQYLNKFEDGETKIRIMAPCITGWQWWVKDGETNKPVRVADMPDEVPADAEQDKFGNYVKYFESFIVWNYAEGKLQIMQIIQTTIQNALMALDTNDDWGDLRTYDVKIVRSKEGDMVKYSVIPSPPSEMPLEAANAFETEKINLDALYEGGDPFKA